MEEKLIEAVRSRPPIYNLEHPNYKNIRIRDKYWKEIAAIIGESRQRCRQCWKSLRERARKKFNAYTGSGSGSGEPTSWPYANFLLFIRDKFGITKTISNFIEETENSSEDCVASMGCYVNCDLDAKSSDGEISTACTSATLRQGTSSLCYSASSAKPSPTPRKRRRLDDGKNEIISEAVQSFNSLLGDIRTKYVGQKDNSPMMLFFENLSRRIEGKYTESQELELQQPFLQAFIRKTREFTESGG